MKYIIFGGAGFIGYHLKNTLRKANIEFRSYDINPGIDESYIDVRKKITLNEKFDSDDIIINLAAIHTTPGHPDYDYFETNIKGAVNICEFAERVGIQTIVFTSSIAPYGASEEEKVEDTLPTPNTPYGISKLVAEKEHEKWAAQDINGRRLLILRPGVVFGKGEGGNFTRLYAAIKKRTFFYPGRKNTIKACIYVKDLIDMTFQLLNSYRSGIKLYNFAYSPAYTIEEIVHNIAQVTKTKESKLLINGKLLRFTAQIISALGGKRYGIHPDRVKKLMISTNISGKRLIDDGFNWKFGFKDAIKDWYIDNNKEALR